jgi:lipoate-protein ligase A
MAIDYILSSQCKTTGVPILRFYGWDPYCLSIGYHQKPDLIERRKLKENGYDFARRPTGGRAIFHAEELTYSIHIPKDLLHHQKLYLYIHEIFCQGLRDLGYQVALTYSKDDAPKISNMPDDIPCFTKSAWSEVQFEGKKVIGSAQKLYQNSILQHGSLLIGKQHMHLPVFLNIDEKDRYQLQEEMKLKTICLNEINPRPISINLLITSILNQLELMTNISVNLLDLTESEYQSAKRRADLFC